jgi:Zn-dependent protease with chaperone function/rRNA maturation endonuclease Nob1
MKTTKSIPIPINLIEMRRFFMRNSELQIADFRYEKELPTLFATLGISGALIAVMFVINLIVGIGFLVALVSLMVNLYLNQVTMLGRCVRVSEKQFPRIHALCVLSAQRLNMPMPPVFIMQNPIINAFATGFFGNYYVVLHSAIVDALSDEELMYIIGHEFMHVKGHHVMINVITGIGSARGLAVLPGLSWIQQLISFTFKYLSRCFEFTCDRGGLIAAGDVKAVITTQTKLAVGPALFEKVDIMEFYQQALDLDKTRLGFIAELGATHPYTINRIRDAVRFYRSEAYKRISAAQGKSGTSTLQGSLATGDLIQRIVQKKDNKTIDPSVKAPISAPQETCKNCGSYRKPNASICTACGVAFAPPSQKDEREPLGPFSESTPQSTQNQEKKCPACQVVVSMEAAFCTECGSKL